MGEEYPPVPDARAAFDNVAWDKNDEAWEESQKYFRSFSTLRKLENLVTRKLGKTATWVTPMRIGGYNNLYQMRTGEFNDVMIRLPQPNLSQFPVEKTVREAATVRFISQHSVIPVPQTLFSEISDPDSDIGPFTIIQFVENIGTMAHHLAKSNPESPDAAQMLDPDISEHVLEEFYRKLAYHLLQLFDHSLPSIGSLDETSKNIFTVEGRPITQNMNNMLQLANIPTAALPPKDRTYKTADDWYTALAEMHIVQLVFQHNDLVTTDDDCRNKYISRIIFLRLARQGGLSTFGFSDDIWSAQAKVKPATLPAPSGTDSFRLWGDDLRPGNVLLDEAKEIASVIDWEFTYAVPTQFTLDPPWWLLLDVPESWHAGIDDWTNIYSVRLQSWLRAFEKVEQTSDIKTESGNRLSEYMRESWEMGRFWLSYAARKSWAFDTIFWKYLDEKFFGSRNGLGNIAPEQFWKTRLHLLSELERAKMEEFVERKMEESKERVLVEWDDQEVKSRLSDVLSQDEIDISNAVSTFSLG